MIGVDDLTCLCAWAGEPGNTWRKHFWTAVRARLHKLRHQRAMRTTPSHPDEGASP